MKKSIVYTNPYRKSAKLRFTVVRERKFLRCACVVVAAVILAAAPFLQATQPVSADRLSDLAAEIDAVNAKIKDLEGKANRLANESKSLANEIARLQNEAAALQAKIELSQKEEQKLNDEITLNEIKITQNRQALGTIIANSYLESKISLLEKIASSDKLSKFIDQETASSAASDALSSKVKEIKALKAKLETQRKEVQDLIEDQKAQKTALAQKRQEQEQLLAKTQGDEAIFRGMTDEANATRQALLAEQRKIMDELLAGQNVAGGTNGEGAFRNHSAPGGCGAMGYPYCMAQDSFVDPWALYNRECVSYAAWRVTSGYGKYVTSFMGQGNAKQWPNSAPRLMGARTDNYPEVGAVAIWQIGPYGHAMVVEEILNDGWVKVSQMNFYAGQYSTMEIPASGAVYVHFRNR
ncbi:MAG: CHAP domain-containing protein [Candidatus Nomurabacteria bacterium]|jgi:surface antigen/cell shape-determining protein MreC|nr:CHAP domain-containing protein [Candidatus Nomurabacteria bacterium]